MATIDRSDVINNGRITPFSGWSNRSYLAGRSRPRSVGAVLAGLNGLGDLVATDKTGSIIDPATIAAMNSESVFLVNLYKQAAGQPMLTAQGSAPTVNVGITPQTQKLLLAAGLLGVLFFLRRR